MAANEVSGNVSTSLRLRGQSRPARHDSAIRAAAGHKEKGAVLALRSDVEPAQRRQHSRPQLHADCGGRRAAGVWFGAFARDVRGLERCGSGLQDSYTRFEHHW